MTKKDLYLALKEELGDWASRSALKKYLKCGSVYLNDLLSEVSFRVQGRKKLYFTKDVADALSSVLVRRLPHD